ncbi:MAG: amidohydrolase family protein [Gemmatimonadetes bacterium]|nr:amidohydrolase family protein [Gemmatimonadota bacterium]MYB06870.1 amidohydrolase family protein [Gemmatimonadota bacterium]MYE15700.1 amidohydrolase family protein [Gemmatimonadota bacterium]MYG23720.1 amidohydrolase family protein [Gemmatimonadota bacterium]MYJ40071.1 amidohydrolase family protein [Gemmatimonadota bacterium]
MMKRARRLPLRPRPPAPAERPDTVRLRNHSAPGAGPSRSAWLPFTALPLCLAGCSSAASVDPAADLVIYNVRVWDGTGAETTPPSVLQIGGGRILSLAPMPEEGDVWEMADAAGVESLDANTWYVVPGLINTHGHIAGTWIPNAGVEYREYASRELGRYARFGVTTVNSLGGEREPAFGLRDASWGDDATGRARLLVSGPVVTGANPEEAMVITDRVAALGPDWIKIRVDDNLGTTTKMTPETYTAVITRARDHGLRVASHLFYQEDARGLLRAGTGMVAHSIRDGPVDEETIDLLLETGVCYVPTLTREVSTYAYGERPAFFDDPFLALDVDSAQVVAVSDPDRQARVRASGAAEAYGRALEIAQGNLALLSRAGVPIAFGTDSGPVGRFQGYFEHMEMELMAEAGLSPAQILRSATGVAADCLGRGDIGTLEPGRRADFIVLRADPLRELANMRSIEGVWVGGERIDGSRRF